MTQFRMHDADLYSIFVLSRESQTIPFHLIHDKHLKLMTRMCHILNVIMWISRLERLMVEWHIHVIRCLLIAICWRLKVSVSQNIRCSEQ